MFKWLKRKKLPEKNSSETQCRCGSYNVITGETTEGMPKVKKSTTSRYSEPEFVGILTIPITTYYQHLFFGTRKINETKEKVSLYRRRNNWLRENEYFYNRNGRACFIDTDAFELGNQTIILLSEGDNL